MGTVRAVRVSGSKTMPQSISGLSTSTQVSSIRTRVGRLVVEWKPSGKTPSRSAVRSAASPSIVGLAP
jgi:hypothetical protein